MYKFFARCLYLCVSFRIHLQKSENTLTLEGGIVKNNFLANLPFPAWKYFPVSCYNLLLYFLGGAFSLLYLSTSLRQLYALYVKDKIVHGKEDDSRWCEDLYMQYLCDQCVGKY